MEANLLKNQIKIYNFKIKGLKKDITYLRILQNTYKNAYKKRAILALSTYANSVIRPLLAPVSTFLPNIYSFIPTLRPARYKYLNIQNFNSNSINKLNYKAQKSRI